MKKKNIYVNQSQELLRLFEEAGNGSKVMCVPMDYAKKDHVVMLCDGNGHILRKPFPVKNSPEGIEYLIEQVTRSCQHRQIDPKHVFFGGEDVGSFAENFIHTLRSGGVDRRRRQRPGCQETTSQFTSQYRSSRFNGHRFHVAEPQGQLFSCTIRYLS